MSKIYMNPRRAGKWSAVRAEQQAALKSAVQELARRHLHDGLNCRCIISPTLKGVDLYVSGIDLGAPEGDKTAAAIFTKPGSEGQGKVIGTLFGMPLVEVDWLGDLGKPPITVQKPDEQEKARIQRELWGDKSHRKTPPIGLTGVQFGAMDENGDMQRIEPPTIKSARLEFSTMSEQTSVPDAVWDDVRRSIEDEQERRMRALFQQPEQPEPGVKVEKEPPLMLPPGEPKERDDAGQTD